MGFEPTCNGFAIRCLTTWLPHRKGPENATGDGRVNVPRPDRTKLSPSRVREPCRNGFCTGFALNFSKQRHIEGNEQSGHLVRLPQSTVIDLLTFFGTSGWTPWSAMPRRSR